MISINISIIIDIIVIKMNNFIECIIDLIDSRFHFWRVGFSVYLKSSLIFYKKFTLSIPNSLLMFCFILKLELLLILGIISELTLDLQDF